MSLHDVCYAHEIWGRVGGRALSHACACTHARTCMHAHTHAHMHTHTHEYTRMRTRIHTHAHTNTHTYEHTNQSNFKKPGVCVAGAFLV